MRESFEAFEQTKGLERLKTQFFASVSHGLRTSLASILGPTERLLRRATLDEETRADLELIADNAHSLMNQVNELLDVSKLEVAKTTATGAETDLAGVLRWVATPFEPVAASEGIRFSIEGPAALAAEVDGGKVERVLVNLLSNAFKFTPSGGRIRCALERVGRHARFLVADSGPGVLPERRAVVFERLRRLDGPGQILAGTGLGLAIAKEFVELMGGSIVIADAPEGGALFIVDLPLFVEPETIVHAPSEDGKSAAVGEAAALVLVVENDFAMNRRIADSLATYYRVVSAFDGEDGLAKAIELVPDAVIADVMMPGVDGDGLVRRIRACTRLDGVPVILLTDGAEDELCMRLMQSGAQDYVMKPCVLEQVRARVKNLVTIKRTREALQRALDSKLDDIEVLAMEAAQRKNTLQVALDAMSAARDRSARLSRYRRDFLGLVSHELRTPLTALSLHLDGVIHDSDALSPRHRMALRRMEASCSRMFRLLESLLQHARIQGGNLAVEREPCVIETIVSEAIQDLQIQADQKGLALEFNVAGQHVVHSDARVLSLVVSNLVHNAIKFTSAKGSVKVSVTDAEGSVAIAVADSGRGIAPVEHSRIFQPFEQLEAISNRHTAGIGLGLALVQEMLPLLEGSIQLDSELGSGSVFTVTLPVVPTRTEPCRSQPDRTPRASA